MASLDFPNPAVTPAFMPANSTAYAWNGTLWLGNRMPISAAASSPTIAFRSHTSTGYLAGVMSTVLTPPAGLANGDILVAMLITARGTLPIYATTPPAGFTAWGTPTAVNDGGLWAELRMYWKRAASESGSYTFAHAGTINAQGLMQVYSGCKASGTPLGATSNNNGTGSAASGTSITTTAANSWLLYQAHDWEGTGTLTPPTGMTERFDSLLYSADQLIASAGATGARSQTNANIASGRWAVRMVELLAA